MRTLFDRNNMNYTTENHNSVAYHWDMFSFLCLEPEDIYTGLILDKAERYKC